MKKSLYLIDVSSLFFRAFYAIRPLTSPSGLPVNAIYGFSSMILKLLKDEKPTSMVFCYDRKEPSFRKEIYQDYKANRSEMPEDLGVQIPYIKKIAELLGIPSIESEGYEADDIIGTLALQGKEKGYEVFIVSGDKDFAQLLNGNIFIFDTMKNIKYDKIKAKEKWGVDPVQMIDYLSLVGDSSDNIPGVAGIGPKGAQKLLEEFGTLESIYEKLEKISSQSLRTKLEDSRENAFMSKKLVTIFTDVPLDDEHAHYRFQPPKKDELIALLKELNFQNLIKTLGELDLSGESASSAAVVESLVLDLPAPVDSVPGGSVPVGDEVADSSAVTLQFTEDPLKFFAEAKNLVGALLFESTLYLFNGERSALEVNDFLHPQVLDQIKEYPELKWWGFDVKSCWHHLRLSDPQLEDDNQLFAYSLKSMDTSSIKRVAREFLNKELSETVEDFISVQFELRDFFSQDIHQRDIYEKIEKPLAPILYQMEQRGIRIDIDFLKSQSVELSSDLIKLEKEIVQIAGEQFNVASPKQLSVVLFEKLKLPVIKKTKTGNSTDNEVLEKLDHPITKFVLEYRELAKLKSTYIDALPLLADENSRLHTSFNQAVTMTGRLSSTNPNLQNIPIRTERGQKVRKAFIADEGKCLLSVDYSQVELRVLAHISQDKALSQAFIDDLDVHAATAAEVFGVPLSGVTPDLRRTAKAINFGIAYGQGAFGLAEVLKISRTEAKEIISKYFQRFQGVQQYIESTIREAHEKGYVETLFGRRRYIEELKSKIPAMKSFGERAAINAPIQGTASDLIKKAMIEIAKDVQVPIILQVHDELIFEASRDHLERDQEKIRSIMENAMTLSVPLKVNLAIGKNWDEAH